MLNSLVELAGQSPTMSNHVLEGFKGFAELLRLWLEEAEQKGMLTGWPESRRNCRFPGDLAERGGPLYAASQDPAVWQHTLAQLHLYQELEKPKLNPAVFFSLKIKESAL